MLTKFKRCRGFKLFRWGNFQIELWYCPKNTYIPPHTHQNIDSTIVHLLGRVHWYIEFDGRPFGKYLAFRNIGKHYRVKPNVVHAFDCYTPAFFLNIERWSAKPTSAAVDFHPL